MKAKSDLIVWRKTIAQNT